MIVINVFKQISPRSIVLLASRGQPDGFAGVAQYLVPLGAAKVADLQEKGLLLHEHVALIQTKMSSMMYKRPIMHCSV